MKNNLDIVFNFTILLAIAYQLLRIEKAIYKLIDNLGKTTNKINSIERDFGSHIAASLQRNEIVYQLLQGLTQKIKELKHENNG